MSKKGNATVLDVLTGKALALLAAVATALGLVLSFATPAVAATRYAETGTFERGQNYILVAETTGGAYAIQLGSSNKSDGSGGTTSLPSVAISISEGSRAFVTVSDETLVWNARSVGNNGVQLYCEATVQDTNQQVDNRPSHYLYPSSTCLKTQDEGVRDIRWQDSQLSVNTTNSGRYYVTCTADGTFGTSATQANAASFRIFVEDDTPAPEEFTVTFLNYDGTQLSSTTYPAGTKATDVVQPSPDPTRPDDESHTYTFKGWDKAIADVTANATYTATYDVTNLYTVKFVNYDGTELSSNKYAEGTKASDIDQPDKVPTKPADDEYTYAFDGWDKPLADVTADATYTATYTAYKKASWVRLAGSGRYDTMAEIVKAGFTSADVAVLATGKDFPDALVASSVAGALQAPVVLTKPEALSEQAEKQLKDLGAKTVYIMGGNSAVSAKAEDEVKALGISTVRVMGSSRQGTTIEAMKTLKDLGTFNGTVVIATGYNFADALAIGPWCYKTGTPILLTNKSGKLTDAQVEACKELGVTKAYIVGGAGVVDDAVADQLGLDKESCSRMAGSNRYDTAAVIVAFELIQGMKMTNVTVATGQKFPDALAGAALCGVNNSVLLLARNENSKPLEFLDTKPEIAVGYVLGGEGAVSAELYDYLVSKTQ